MNSMRILLSLVGVLVLVSCEDVRRAEQTLVRRDTAANSGADVDDNTKGSPVGPAYKTVDVMREGTRDTMRLRLTGSARGFEPPFYTYVPVDMIFEPLDAAIGEGFRFTANFAGQRRNDAFVLMVAYPQGTSEGAARANVESYIAGRELMPSEGNRERWSIAEWAFRGTTHAGDPIHGWVGLGRHADRYFIFGMEHPPEFSEGMGVRADQIMKEWRWLPEASPLGN